MVREVNRIFAREIALGHTVTLPCRMGKLELHKREAGARIKDGNLKVTYPVDWRETLRLWHEDEGARKGKTLVRYQQKFVYRVRYKKYSANYPNKSFYKFRPCRTVKAALKKNIEGGITDTLW